MRRIWSFSKPRIPYRTGTFLISTPNKPQDHEESGLVSRRRVMSDSQRTSVAEVTAPARRIRWRSIAAVICVVVAALLTTPAGVAFWGQRTLNDAQRYLDTVGPLVDSPQVQEVISTKAIDA